MLLEIQESRIDGVLVLQMTGKLALGSESQRVETMVEDLARRGEKRVIFDMTGVTYIDSAGIGMLAMAAGTMKEAAGKLVVVSPAGNRTTHLLKLTQMHLLVTVCGTMADATASLS